MFTIDSAERFLVMASYFDALDASSGNLEDDFEDLIDAALFLFRLDNAGLVEQLFRPGGGVEFDGQGRERKQGTG